MILIPPTEEQQKYIREVVKEDLNTRNDYVDHMKTWLKEQPHLPDTCDEILLLNFLRGVEFSVEKCKKKLDRFFTVRTFLPKFFKNRDVKDPGINSIPKIAYATVLSSLTPQCRRVCITTAIEGIEFCPNDIVDCFKIFSMAGEIGLMNEVHGVTGQVIIVDANLATKKLLQNTSLKVTRKFINMAMEAYPMKLKEIHVINVSPLATFFTELLKPFVKQKIRERIYLHSSMETLYKYVPQKMLPEECGGAAGKIKDLMDDWLAHMEKYTDYFKEQESLKSDESKRPLGHDKQEIMHGIFGTEGSFRQLKID